VLQVIALQSCLLQSTAYRACQQVMCRLQRAQVLDTKEQRLKAVRPPPIPQQSATSPLIARCPAAVISAAHSPPCGRRQGPCKTPHMHFSTPVDRTPKKHSLIDQGSLNPSLTSL
jgi:hypothetical protein